MRNVSDRFLEKIKMQFYAIFFLDVVLFMRWCRKIP